MKKIRIIGIILVAALCVMTQLSGISHAGVKGVAGSKHDLSLFALTGGLAALGRTDTTTSYKYQTLEVCTFCHTPHSAKPDAATRTYWNGSAFVNSGGSSNSVMLWNRDLGQAAGTTAVNTYQSSTMDAMSGTAGSGEIWAYSLMCLSCHDGVSAINVLYKNPYDGTGARSTPAPYGGANTYFGQEVGYFPGNIGERHNPGSDTTTHLENDHPVSINYVTARTNDAGLYDNGSLAYVQDEKVRLFPDKNGNVVAVECSSCHDPHNEGSSNVNHPDPTVAGKYPFLNVNIVGSNLCTMCHKK